MTGFIQKLRTYSFFSLLVSSLVFCILSNVQGQVFKPKIVYQSADLQIIQISENSFLHTSYLQTNDFGKVPCNGLISRDANEVIVFDTPTNNKSADALIKYIRDVLHCRINAIIPTHFHDDCLGGLAAFHENNVPSYGNVKTIELAKANQTAFPQHAFKDSLKLNLGQSFVMASFFGEGHTRDNVVGYFPKEKILFGGCLIKEVNATNGYLGDANVSEWSKTVEKIKQTYQDVRLVIPGHGEIGGRELLDYTISLFK